MNIIENSSSELIREFIALRVKTSVLEVNTVSIHGSIRKLQCGDDEELRYLQLAKDNDGLRMDRQGILEFRTDDQTIRLEWVDAQPSSTEDESLISAIAKPIL